jgi:two-component system sensor histidine kinase RegB
MQKPLDVDLADVDLGRHARRLRLDTLVRLRWLAIAGQSVAVLSTWFILGFDLPIALCFAVIAASVWLNIGLRLKFPLSQRLRDPPAFALLAFDVLQLSGLLYLTGGLSNPFTSLFLAPIMISAMSLAWQGTLWLLVLMVGSATLLAFWHVPLPWHRAQPLELPFLYVSGIWMALVLGAAFIAVFASRVSEEARQLSDALAATELVLAREQHLTQLDGLAAAAAHELGTPLATITLVVKELGKIVKPGDAMAEDIALLAQEVGRCRTILSKIASLGNEGPGMLDELTILHLVEDVVRPQRDFGVALRIVSDGDGPEPICRRNPGMLYGLGNLVENAIDFAMSEVRITIGWSEAIVTIGIADDGPGFSPDVLTRLGEPYITSRGQRRAKVDEGSGLGLGLFIAKTLLERSGASVTTANAPAPEHGARVMVAWPRASFERRPRKMDVT